MSAWILSPRHITALVDGAIQLNLIPETDATKVGRMLTNANKRSIRARYGRWDEEASEVATYHYPWSRRREPEYIPLAVLYKHAACYEYQTCEFDGYPRSQAGRLIKKMLRTIADTLGIGQDDISGLREYRDAPWGI